jgi:hypothetical protein
MLLLLIKIKVVRNYKKKRNFLKGLNGKNKKNRFFQNNKLNF